LADTYWSRLDGLHGCTSNHQGGQAVNLPQSSIIDKIADHRDELLKKNKQLNQRIKHLEASLRRIANQDYRGNRSTESQIAFEALKP
jgi:hypothetical protein